MKNKVLSLTTNINENLVSNINSFKDMDKDIKKSMLYSVEAGGKRLRPLLLISTFLQFSDDLFTEEDVLPFALSIEYIHTYSLIHDDLPCMDDDDLRRGKPTNHIAFGEAMALLAGDGLLNLAFETNAKAMNKDYNLPQFKRIVLANEIISSCSGTSGMIKGQVLDVFNEDKNKTIDFLKEIHINKTGKLFYASLISGAVLAGANEKIINKYIDLANLLGLAFQIQDDLLDFVSSTEELGKPIGSDEKNDKLTYVTFYGVEKSKEIFENTKNEILIILEDLEITNSLVGYIIKHTIDKI